MKNQLILKNSTKIFFIELKLDFATKSEFVNTQYIKNVCSFQFFHVILNVYYPLKKQCQ